MVQSDFYKNFLNELKTQFPKTSKSSLENVPFEKLISPHIIRIPKSVLDKAEKLIKLMFKVSRTEKYKSLIKSDCDQNDQEILNYDSSNLSLLMAYDFHIQPETGQVKLIEVNTNGAGFLFSNLTYKANNIKPPINGEPMTLLKESFQNELNNLDGPSKIFIVDEDLKTQKMLFEFHLYKELFESWGLDSDIEDVEDLKLNGQLKTPDGETVSFIYNRFCDFLLREEKSKDLRSAYLNHLCRLSPNPKEYLLLADKTRLINLSDEKFIQGLDLSSKEEQLFKETIPASFDLSHFENSESVWENRKKYFFKPKRSHGGKSSYRGKTMTKSVFARMIKESTLIQEIIPPPVFQSSSESGESQDWKYDFRIYAYGDQIQQVACRLYQGQVTNFNTPHGGFAAIRVI